MKYHLYYFQDHALIGADTVEAADDDAACRIAEEADKGQSVEIWNGHTRIGVVTPASAAARPRPRRSA